MPVFNCFFKIMRKNTAQILIYVAVFTAISIIVTGASASTQEDVYKDTAASVAVIDRDNSELSAALTQYIGERHELVDVPDDSEKLQNALFYRNVVYILFISEGFQDNLTGGSDANLLQNVKPPESTSGIYIDNQIDSYLSTVRTYLRAGYEISEAAGSASDDMKLAASVRIYDEKAEQDQISAYYFQFLPYILIAVIISAIGPVIIIFNKSDLAKRIESSSFKLRERNTQIALGCIVSAILVWSVFIAVSFVLYGGEMLSEAGLFRIVNSAAYLVVCVCVAFLTGQLVKNAGTLAAVCNVLGLGMSFLCGVFVPQELLGSGVLFISKFLPAYWYIRSNDIMLAVTELSEANTKIFTEGIAIQLGFAAAIFAIALVVSRQKKINSIV